MYTNIRQHRRRHMANSYGGNSDDIDINDNQKRLCLQFAHMCRTSFSTIDGLVQEIRNSITNALELRIYRTSPSICTCFVRCCGLLPVDITVFFIFSRVSRGSEAVLKNIGKRITWIHSERDDYITNCTDHTVYPHLWTQWLPHLFHNRSWFSYV